MRTWPTRLALVITAATLTGCGKNPSAAAPALQSKRFAPSATRTVPPKAPTPAAQVVAAPLPATVSTRPGAASKPASGQPVASTPAAAPAGAVKLKVRTFGASTVGSLVLNIVSQADPSLAAMVPLAMNGAEATWETEELSPGDYDMVIEVRDAAGKRIGGGKTVAKVIAGELAAVTIDITVEAAAATPAPSVAPGPGGNSGVAASPTPTPVASEAPTASQGGTLGIRVEFL